MAPVRSPDRPADMARIAEVVDRVQAGDPEATALAASLSDADIRALSAEQRIALIRAMVGGWMMANIAERTVVKVIEAVREEDAGELLAAMREDGSALLQRLESSFQGAEYLKFLAALRLAYLRNLGPAELARRAPTAKTYPWASPGIGPLVRGEPWGRILYESRGFTPDGRIGFNVFFGFQAADKPVVLEPFELIKVPFFAGEPEAGYAKGETALMPAVNLAALATLQFRQQLRAGAAVVMLVGSGAGFAGATTAIGRAVAGLDFAMGAAALVVDTCRTEIAASPEGRELLQAWDVLQTAMLVFGMARVLWEAPGTLRDVGDRWRKWRLQARRPAGEIALDQEIAELLAQVGTVERLEGRLDELLSQYELALQRFEGAEEILERVDDIRALMAKGDVDAAVRQADQLEWDLSLIDEDLGGLATPGPRPFDDATEVLQGKMPQVEGLRKRPPLPPVGAPESRRTAGRKASTRPRRSPSRTASSSWPWSTRDGPAGNTRPSSRATSAPRTCKSSSRGRAAGWTLAPHTSSPSKAATGPSVGRSSTNSGSTSWTGARSSSPSPA